MINIKKIVVPTDFSRLSLTALDYALDIAEHWGASISIVHVIDEKPPVLGIGSLKLSEEEYSATIKKEAENKMENLLEEYSEKRKIRMEGEILTGLDYQEISDYSEVVEADMIIIATHGRTGVLHTLLGSVAEKIIRYCKIPVLVTTPSQEDTEN